MKLSLSFLIGSILLLSTNMIQASIAPCMNEINQMVESVEYTQDHNLLDNGGRKKKGTVTNVDLEKSRIIIFGEDGTNYVVYAAVGLGITIGSPVDFTTTEEVDFLTGYLIGIDLSLSE